MGLKKQRGEATEETKDGVHSLPESDLRKWEDLDQDCLVRILRKVGMKTLITCVPFVCKSWYKASLLPDCWVKISFDECLLGSDVELNAKFVKFVVKRSAGATQFLQLPVNCGSKAWDYISDGCPALKRLCFMVPK